MQAASVFKTGPAVLGHVPSVLIEGQTRDHVGGLQREGGGIDAQVFWRRVLQQHGVRAAEQCVEGVVVFIACVPLSVHHTVASLWTYPGG